MAIFSVIFGGPKELVPFRKFDSYSKEVIDVDNLAEYTQFF